MAFSCVFQANLSESEIEGKRSLFSCYKSLSISPRVAASRQSDTARINARLRENVNSRLVDEAGQRPGDTMSSLAVRTYLLSCARQSLNYADSGLAATALDTDMLHRNHLIS